MVKFLISVLQSLFGDTLPRFAGWLLGLAGAEFKSRKLEQQYLDALVQHYRGLPLRLPRDVSPELSGLVPPMELEQVYVELAVSDPNFEARAQASINPPLPRPSRVSEAIRATQRLVLRGAAGSGKSTTLRYLAVTCARALRNNRRDGDSSKLIRKRLGWDKRFRPFPILVQLEDVVQAKGWVEKRSLPLAVAEVINQNWQLVDSECSISPRATLRQATR